MGNKFRISYFGWLVLLLSAIPAFAQPVSVSNTPLADNEGTRLGRYRILDCVGAGVDCTLSNGTLTVTISSSGSVSDTVYGAGWNGDTTVAPSKNAVYDKIETLGAGSGDITSVGDVTSGAAFDGTSGNTLQFEGSTADTNETTLIASDPAADFTVTIPAATDTLVGKATTDTLTNKTMAAADNVLDADTAVALAADPADCATATHFAVGVTAAGAATCEAIADADVPNTITVDLATVATTANAGDSATAFFGAGTIEHERGGLEADISAYDGLIGITGGATYNQTGTTTQIIIFDGAGAPTSAAISGQSTMTNAGVMTNTDMTCTDCIGDTEISTHAGTSLAADLEEEVTEGSLADSTITSADILDSTIATGDIAADTITGADTADDTFDFIDFEDTLDLDAALTLNQTTLAWSQTFTGTTQIGLTYTANSLTTGDAINVASSATGLTGDLTQIELTGANTGNTGNVLKVGYTGTTGSATAVNVTNAGTGLSFRVNDDGTYADTTSVVIDASGQMGIGNTAPAVALDVTGAITASTTVSAATLTLTGTGTINGLDAIDSTTETFLESALDIAGDVSSTGMSTTVIGNDKVLEVMLKAVDAAGDEECLTYETTTGDFEWQTCGSGGGGATSLSLPIYSAKLTGAFVVFTPPTADACTQGAQIDAGEGPWRLLFDATTDECATWQFIMPNNYSSTPLLDVIYSMTSATSGTVEFEAAVMCVSPDDAADIGTASFSNVAVATETVPGTAGYTGILTISLTDDSCAAGDTVFVVVSMDANDGTNSTATGDTEIIGLNLRYTGL